jgi:hypothetical protein
VNYPEMDVTTPVLLTVSNPAHGYSHVARRPCKATIVAALPEAIE